MVPYLCLESQILVVQPQCSPSIFDGIVPTQTTQASTLREKSKEEERRGSLWHGVPCMLTLAMDDVPRRHERKHAQAAYFLVAELLQQGYACMFGYATSSLTCMPASVRQSHTRMHAVMHPRVHATSTQSHALLHALLRVHAAVIISLWVSTNRVQDSAQVQQHCARTWMCAPSMKLARKRSDSLR